MKLLPVISAFDHLEEKKKKKLTASNETRTWTRSNGGKKTKTHECVSAIENGSPYYTNQINHSANIVSLRGPMTASPVRYFH